MLVYRYLSLEELNKITSGQNEDIGSKFHRTPFNNHRYSKSHYLHFFKDLSGLLDIRVLYRDYDNEFYFCSFDIPRTKLLFHRGIGYYEPHNYDTDTTNQVEYAIPISKFDPSWLVNTVPDKFRDQPLPIEQLQELLDNQKNM